MHQQDEQPAMHADCAPPPPCDAGGGQYTTGAHRPASPHSHSTTTTIST